MYSFSLNIPDGWKSASKETRDLVASSMSPNDLVFVVLEREPGPGVPDTVIAVKGERFSGTPGVSVEKVRTYSESVARKTGGVLLRSPVRVSVGGIDMYRGDVKATSNGHPNLLALLAVGIRDRTVVFQVQSSSQDELDEGVRAIAGATEFIPEFTVPSSELDTSKPKIRVSQSVVTAFVQKKLNPVYPEEARRAHVHGTVVLNAEISREGRVQRLWVVDVDDALATPTPEAGHWSGLFTSAAVEAVHQWTFRPYLLNGQPVRLEAHITVTFQD
jgi:protein TonB